MLKRVPVKIVTGPTGEKNMEIDVPLEQEQEIIDSLIDCMADAGAEVKGTGSVPLWVDKDEDKDKEE